MTSLFSDLFRTDNPTRKKRLTSIVIDIKAETKSMFDSANHVITLCNARLGTVAPEVIFDDEKLSECCVALQESMKKLEDQVRIKYLIGADETGRAELKILEEKFKNVDFENIQTTINDIALLGVGVKLASAWIFSMVFSEIKFRVTAYTQTWQGFKGFGAGLLGGAFAFAAFEVLVGVISDEVAYHQLEKSLGEMETLYKSVKENANKVKIAETRFLECVVQYYPRPVWPEKK